MVISPDAHLLHADGRYEWTPTRVYAAWMASMRELAAALPGAESLVLLVGLPGAGKSTWLQANAVEDRVYFDATLTRRADRRVLVKAAQAADRPVAVVWIDTPLDVCLLRNAERPEGRRVPDEVFVRMRQALSSTPPTLQEGFREVLRVVSG